MYVIIWCLGVDVFNNDHIFGVFFSSLSFQVTQLAFSSMKGNCYGGCVKYSY